MMQDQELAQAHTPAAATSGKTADDRSTAFQPVEAGGEQRSGTTMMVEAYVLLWLALMGWLLTLWRRQARMSVRIDDLERAIDRAAAANKGSGKK
jgi:hypothetical protein